MRGDPLERLKLLDQWEMTGDISFLSEFRKQLSDVCNNTPRVSLENLCLLSADSNWPNASEKSPE